LILLAPAELFAEPRPVVVPEGYHARVFEEEDRAALLALFAEVGWVDLPATYWQGYFDKLLPGGLFVMEATATGQLVATAGAVHNPQSSYGYFPFGGEIGNVVCSPAHDGRGLGRVASQLAFERQRQAGYTSVRIVTREPNASALKTYLRMGFVPYLYDADMEARWQAVCTEVSWPFEPEVWRGSVGGRS